MIVCLRLRHFAAQIETHQGHNAPVTLVRDHLVLTSQVTGVEPGMSLPQAQAIIADHPTLPVHESVYRQAFRALVTRLTIFSDRIEPVFAFDTAHIYLDLGRSRPHDGLQLVKQMLDIVQAQRLVAEAGIAQGKATARIAADYASPIRMVPPQQAQAFLAPLPVSVLNPDQRVARKLHLLGIKHVDPFAALPRSAVFAQFSRVGRDLHLLACGEDYTTILPKSLPRCETETQHLDVPVVDHLIVARIGAQITEALFDHMLVDNLAAGRVYVTLSLDNHPPVERSLCPVEPISRKRELLSLVDGLIRDHPVPCGVIGVTVTLDELVTAQPQQLSLFDTPVQRDLETALNRITLRHNTDAIYYAEAMQRHSLVLEDRYTLTQRPGA